MQRIGYALPLTLATPIALLVTQVDGICDTDTLPLPCASADRGYILGAGLLLWLSQFIATTYYIWKSQGQIMAKASDLLWIPSYNGTREGKSTSSGGDDWYKPFWNCLKRVCKCCQSQEESVLTQPKHHGNKRASIIEGRTNITVELSNSSNKLRGQSDPNANTGAALETEECVSKKDQTNVTRLSVPAKSKKTSTDSSKFESHEHKSVFEDECVQSVREISKDVVYSAAEIPRKKLVRTSKRSTSKGDAMNPDGNSAFNQKQPGQSSEPTTSLTKDIKDEVIASSSDSQTGIEENIRHENEISVQEAWADDRDGRRAPINEEEDFKRKSQGYNEFNRFPEDFPTCLTKTLPPRADLKGISVSRNPSKLVLPAIPRAILPKPTENPQINQTYIPQKSQNDSPLIFSTQIESTQSITVDSSEYQLEINSRSRAFQAQLPVPAKDESSRPGSALENVSDSDPNSPVEDWIPDDLKDYATSFRENGYEKAKFIAGLNDRDLESIGIQNIGHRQKLLRKIKKIPRIEIEENIPENVESWLQEHDLEEYWPSFRDKCYTEPSDLVDLKNMSKDRLKEVLLIQKPGHLNRLKSLINKLQYPNRGQKKIRRTRNELGRLPLKLLDLDNSDEGYEYNFWNDLRQECLIPENSAFGQTAELKEKLVELRNTTFLVFGVSNALWMIIILALVRHKDLKILGVDVIGLGFLTIYGGIFAVQFLALLWHRFKTLIHILARAPWKMNINSITPAESSRSQQTS
ncbi:Ankyrin repeat and sterile alpha motif domain-containing protein 1B [Stylophora pistillata]|uniref:Ankyrin repeat and sterile alpha motif domain-containing protein 1B n=1 Tax=Stylophora pistillata TaxID=50429 RepID=A0A2B4S303_STYPI|nr:Ankyrin repeat and sterile alpha motif domain-containing protein 1B [Stylophora pistillata]